MDTNKIIDPTILIVDDHPSNLELLGSALMGNHYKVAFATNGVQAIQIASVLHPDLILLDIMMPGLDGIEVCKELKSQSNTKHIPILFLTAKNDTDDIVRGFEAGGEDYVTKPFSIPELISRIKTHIELKKSRDTILQQNSVLRQLKGDLEERLIELNKLNASKDKFFSIIAHDLRNPFSGLLGLASYLHEELDSLQKEEISEVTRVMKDSAYGIFQLLNNLLDWARIQTGKISYTPAVVKLEEAIKYLLDINSTSIHNKQLKINVQIDDFSSVETDVNILSSVLNNIFTNAIKFTPKKGTITLKSEFDDGNVYISVTDTGVGIHLNRIRDMFELANYNSTEGTENEKGTGLGLILTKELVEKLGGKISLTSELGVGTKVVVSIPMVHELIKGSI